MAVVACTDTEDVVGWCCVMCRSGFAMFLSYGLSYGSTPCCDPEVKVMRGASLTSCQVHRLSGTYIASLNTHPEHRRHGFSGPPKLCQIMLIRRGVGRLM
jgi:hypothetical protein